MAVQGTQITLTTAPTVIAGNGSHGNIRVIVRNRGTGAAYLGGSTFVVRGKCYFHARHADVGEIHERAKELSAKTPEAFARLRRAKAAINRAKAKARL